MTNAGELREQFGLPNAPTVAMEGETVVVQLPAEGGRVIFTFDEIEAGRKLFDCELSVRMDAAVPGLDGETSGNLNGASLSSRETYRRMLDNHFGKAMDWTRLLNQAYTLAKAHFLSASHAVDIEDVPLDFSQRYRVEGLIPEEGVVIPFGMGDSAKTYQVLSICMAAASGREWLGRASQASRILFLDYEATEREHRRRWHRLSLSHDGYFPPGSFHYLSARGIAFVEQVPLLRRELERTGADLLVVDSAVAACGGDPLKPEPVKSMFNAMNALALPVVLIAHCTKENGDATPFGTVFWHNLARMTWNIQKVSSEESPDIQCGWFNKKANNDRKQRSFGVELRFDDPEGPVAVQSYEVAKITSLRGRLEPTSQILAVLGEEGACDVSTILERTGIKEKTAYNALNRLVMRKTVVQIVEAGKARKWALRSDREEHPA